ncbi:hypothetical protein B0H13DRAFT_2300446 [Mycena leptocephala]|nr:hypothetical protein B0H13DRAFT_2300446 [Mycena leptocephala]
MDSTSLLSRFPQELIDKIITQNASDKPTLRSCALVCRAFLPFFQACIFSEVELIHQDETQQLHDILVASPHLGGYVRTLTITNDNGEGPSWPHCILPLETQNTMFLEPQMQANRTTNIRRTLHRQLSAYPMSFMAPRTPLSMTASSPPSTLASMPRSMPSVFRLRFASHLRGQQLDPRSVPAARSATAVSHAAANAFRTIDSNQETTHTPTAKPLGRRRATPPIRPRTARASVSTLRDLVHPVDYPAFPHHSQRSTSRIDLLDGLANLRASDARTYQDAIRPPAMRRASVAPTACDPAVILRVGHAHLSRHFHIYRALSSMTPPRYHDPRAQAHHAHAPPQWPPHRTF